MGTSQIYRFLILFLGVFFIFSGLASANEHLLPPLEAQKLIEANRDNPKFIIIDLRSKDEFDNECSYDFKNILYINEQI